MSAGKTHTLGMLSEQLSCDKFSIRHALSVLSLTSLWNVALKCCYGIIVLEKYNLNMMIQWLL
jgi:hypothetical protein